MLFFVQDIEWLLFLEKMSNCEQHTFHDSYNVDFSAKVIFLLEASTFLPDNDIFFIDIFLLLK